MPDLRKHTGIRKPTQGQHNKPGVSYPTPDTGEYLIIERKTVDSKEQPIAYGTAHPTLTEAVLIDQSYETAEDLAKVRVRVYAKRGTPAQQAVYAGNISYAADSNSHKVIVRTLLLPYPATPLAKGTADPVFTDCVLTKEEVTPPADGDAVHSAVTRTYEKLPSPWIPGCRYDDNYGPVQTMRRAVVNTGQQAATTSTTRTNYEARDGSGYVLWEIVESWGTALTPAVAALPIKESKVLTTFGVTTVKEQLVARTGTETATATKDLAGEATRTEYEAVDALTLRKKEVIDKPQPFTVWQTLENGVQIKEKVTYHFRDDLPDPPTGGATLKVDDSISEFPYVMRRTFELPVDPLTGLPIPPQARIEYDTISYTFPGIIASWKARKVDGKMRSNIVFWRNRMPVTMTVAAKKVHSYSLTEPSLDNERFWKVITRPWAQMYFGLPDNTIHPPAPISLRGESIESNGILYEVSGGQASDPPIYMPGQELLIGGSAELWWGETWRKTLIYVKEPT